MKKSKCVMGETGTDPCLRTDDMLNVHTSVWKRAALSFFFSNFHLIQNKCQFSWWICDVHHGSVSHGADAAWRRKGNRIIMLAWKVRSVSCSSLVI